MALSPEEIAEKAQKIYEARYKEEYERKYLGQFVAIDVDSGQAFVARSPEKAVEAAQTAAGGGFIHLIKIGSPGVYHVSYSSANAAKSLFR